MFSKILSSHLHQLWIFLQIAGVRRFLWSNILNEKYQIFFLSECDMGLRGWTYMTSHNFGPPPPWSRILFLGLSTFVTKSLKPYPVTVMSYKDDHLLDGIGCEIHLQFSWLPSTMDGRRIFEEEEEFAAAPFLFQMKVHRGRKILRPIGRWWYYSQPMAYEAIKHLGKNKKLLTAMCAMDLD